MVASAFAPIKSKHSVSNLEMLFGKKKPAAPPAKKVAAPPVKQVSTEFAYGLIGSDVEARNFDPFQLSVGQSEETIAWYRSAELKVLLLEFTLIPPLIFFCF